MPNQHTRRSFLKRTAAAGGALLLPASPWEWIRTSQPVRVRGRVHSRGTGIAGVSVSDGLTVVSTDPSGRFDFLSPYGQSFVHVSVPSGYSIPKNPTGTAAFYRQIPRGGGEAVDASFELEPMGDPGARHTFLALADPQTQNAAEMAKLHAETVPDVLETLETVNGSDVFGVACGDIMFDDLSLYPEYERAVGRTGIPFFQVVGNHDLDFDAVHDGASTRTFESHFGPRYYSFNRGEAHYVVLDDVFWNHSEYIGYLDERQLAWLEADLATVREGALVIVFVHIPGLSTRYRREGESEPSSSSSITNRRALYDLLAPFEAHIISGHTHESEHVFEGGVHEHVLGTACGAWWSGPICYDGTPNGYAVFDVDGSDVRWRYKATGQPAEHQIRVYAPGSDPSAPEEIVANVWDWDPEWTVTWYEDGVRRGQMARRVGLDPWSLEMHAGPEAPRARPWVDPVPNSHMFYAPADANVGSVVVEAVSRFGVTYSARLSPS